MDSAVWLWRVWLLRQARKDFITAKYTEKRFTRRRSPDAAARLQLLYEAVRNRDVLSLIQLYCEGLDLMETCPQPNEHVCFASLLRRISVGLNVPSPVLSCFL